MIKSFIIQRLVLWLALAVISVTAQQSKTGDIRLTGYGSNPYGGLLEVYLNDSWGTVCGNKVFSIMTASVACRQLGLGPAIDRVYYPDLRYGVSEHGTAIGDIVCTGEETHLLRCHYSVHPTCLPYQSIGIICSASSLPYSGSLRLVPDSLPNLPTSTSTGTLQMYLKGAWHSVCSDGFTAGAGNSACRQMGYTGAQVITSTSTDSGEFMWKFNSNSCTNLSFSCLDSCADVVAATVDSPCSDAVSLQCTFESEMESIAFAGNRSTCEVVSPYNGDVRTNASLSDNGFITPEIYTGSDWLNVCVNNFSLKEADVVCKHVGLPAALLFQANQYVTIDNNYGAELECSGIENSVQDCRVSLVPCLEFVSVKCIDYLPPYGSLRLYDGSGSSGSLHLFDGTLFVPLCDHNFGHNELQVACRQLGYDSGIQWINNTLFGLSKFTTEPHEYTFHCSGDEDHLLSCLTVEPGSSVCRNPYDAVAIQCGNSIEGTTRIEGGNDTAGVLQVKLDGQWGTVCGLGFTHRDAHVACRDLGFRTSTGFTMKGVIHEPNVVPIQVTSCKCTGFESSLLSCPHRVADNGTCQHHHDVFLYCGNDDYQVKDGTLRLVNINTRATDGPTTGKMEISYHGLWMSMCGLLFDGNAANVACKQLGYGQYQDYCSDTTCNSNTSSIGEGGDIFFGETHCTGDEDELIECETEIHNSDICTHENNVWITCSAPLRITTTSSITMTSTVTSSSTINPRPSVQDEPSENPIKPDQTNPLPFSDMYLYIIMGGVFLFLLLIILTTCLICCYCIYNKKNRRRYVDNGDTTHHQHGVSVDEPDLPVSMLSPCRATNASFLRISPPQSSDDYSIADLKECPHKELELGYPPQHPGNLELRPMVPVAGACAITPNSSEPSDVFDEADFGSELPPRYEELNFEDSSEYRKGDIGLASAAAVRVPSCSPEPCAEEKELKFTTIRISGEL